MQSYTSPAWAVALCIQVHLLVKVPAHTYEKAHRGVLVCGFPFHCGQERFWCVSNNRWCTDEKHRRRLATGDDNHLHMWVGVNLATGEAGSRRRLTAAERCRDKKEGLSLLKWYWRVVIIISISKNPLLFISRECEITSRELRHSENRRHQNKSGNRPAKYAVLQLSKHARPHSNRTA